MIQLVVEGANGEHTAATIRACLPAGQTLAIARDWPDFLANLPRSGCALVAAPVLTPDLTRRVRELRGLYPLHPIVLVTTCEAESARRLLGLPADGVVWWDRMPAELADVVRDARASSLMERAAAAVDAAPHLPAPLRRALSCALRTVPPPNSVERLAALGGCHRSTLAGHWAAARADGRVHGARLQDVTAWFVLLHAAGRKPAHLKWDVVAGQCGVHVHTLRRACRRLAGLRLADVEGAGRAALLARFADRVLAPLGIAAEFAAPGRRAVSYDA